MLTIFTATNAEYLQGRHFDVRFPEIGLSPNEQINYIEEIVRSQKNLTIATFSPYIVNALNIHIVLEELNRHNLKVIACTELGEFDLVCEDEKGNLIVDTYIFTEPMDLIYNQYTSLTSKVQENTSL